MSTLLKRVLLALLRTLTRVTGFGCLVVSWLCRGVRSFAWWQRWEKERLEKLELEARERAHVVEEEMES